ncbi:MAG: twin-arginine translocase TatA/TatE family subunit [Candidatus Wolframiiraptor sp. EX4484-121]|nr:MAG: twin-arginine translocase TatA/TatE family subunit [Candidatus Wolframiiraptor sp. EX4484-121]
MIQGIEWIIVAAIIVFLLLWGPTKLPKIARSLGEAKKEFEKAVKEAEEVKEAAVEPMKSVATTAAEEVRSAEDKLIEVAKALGIQTEGKTRDQIAKEILEKTKK